MATKILLYDMRFPDQPPRRLTVDDGIAGYAVRSGVAAAADPAQAGALGTGAAVSAATPTAVYLQHGATSPMLTLLILPLAVAQYAAALGLAAGVPLAVAQAIGVGTLDFSDPANSALVL